MNSKCGLSAPTAIPPPIEKPTNPYANNITFCASDQIYTTVPRDTCDIIALKYNISSAALYMGNPNLLNCKNIPTGTKLCLPFPCTPIYTLKDGDTYSSIERSLGLPYSAGYNIRKYNPWITCRPSNIYDASVEIYGTTLCGGPQGGIANGTTPPSSFDYGFEILPPTNVTVAEGTTYRCARWYIVGDQDVDEKTACTKLCLQKSIDWKLFLAANPSLATGVCDEKLVVGSAYCIEVSPNYIDHDDEEEGEDNEDDDVS